MDEGEMSLYCPATHPHCGLDNATAPSSPPLCFLNPSFLDRELYCGSQVCLWITHFTAATVLRVGWGAVMPPCCRREL